MTFNSVAFLIFFPVVAVAYFLLPHRFRWMHLLAASAVFYMFFIPIYLLILVATILVDYVAGRLLENVEGPSRKVILATSLVANIGILAFFKYGNFFIGNWNALTAGLGHPSDVALLNVILPIGLSFHTFQAMSYTIEVYRRSQSAERHFGIFALYVLFFPQLVAGPIERPQNLLPQFREWHVFDANEAVAGLRLMLWGMFKKVVVADRLATIANPLFDQPADTQGLFLWIGTIAFTIQIYCDFSGYSDIAIGSARVLGFRLMKNFHRPYLATSLADHWRRWHISLSLWFRDYVYVPLGGNRSTKLFQMRNVLLVFILSGLWHGASWNYVIWGFGHGIGMALYFLTISPRAKIAKALRLDRIPRVTHVASILATFTFVALGFVVFRSEGLSTALLIYKKMFTEPTIPPEFFAWMFSLRVTAAIVFAGVVILVDCFEETLEARQIEVRLAWPVRWAAYVAAILAILNLGVADKIPFIYFQF